MVEYVKKSMPASGTAKTALGFGIAGTALAALTSGSGIVGNLFGVPRTAALAENVGLISDKEMILIRESSGKDAVIARLEAERYADNLVRVETAPLNARICTLETAAAVNAARDQDFRRYVEREFVHQPKASIRESIVVCKHCGCECDCAC